MTWGSITPFFPEEGAALGDAKDKGAPTAPIQVMVNVNTTWSQLGLLCPPGATWQCLETVSMVTTRGLRYWHLVGRAQGCC